VSHDPYPLKPTDGDLNDESLFTTHSGYRGCQKCETVGAHSWRMVCDCCGIQQSRFHTAEYLDETDSAYD
jgi:hypothetical protein